jgi:cystathionine beta-synthase
MPDHDIHHPGSQTQVPYAVATPTANSSRNGVGTAPGHGTRYAVFNNVLEAIGNTPIVRINRIRPDGVNVNIFAKLEFTNPGGSVKDRIGYWMIEAAERDGRLKPGGTIIENTGGNTGFGLAMAAIVKGYKCIFTMPDKMSEAKIQNLRAMGAEVVVTPTAVAPDDPRSYYSVARKLAEEIPNSVYIDQYNNPSNIEYHYLHTGPEILSQFPDIDVFVSGIGTGGTVMGTGKFRKEQKPDITVLAIDPVGSIIYDNYHFGESRHPFVPYLLEGIGKDVIPSIFDFGQLDDVVQVGDGDAFHMTRRLLAEEGIFAGVSSGAAIRGMIDWIEANPTHASGKNFLVILPDSGSRYISKAYDDDWMREKGFL